MLTLTNLQIAVAVVVVALITFAMVVLVAYTLGDVGTAPAAWLPAVAGIAATAGLHLWRRAIGLSLIGGTGTYVVISLLLT